MLLKLFKPDSLARTRRKIKQAIKQESYLTRVAFSFWQGEYGYQRDKEVYK